MLCWSNRSLIRSHSDFPYLLRCRRTSASQAPNTSSGGCLHGMQARLIGAVRMVEVGNANAPAAQPAAHRWVADLVARAARSGRSKQLIIETRAPIPAKPGRKARHDYEYEYERNGVANLFMVFAPLEGWRHVKVTRCIGMILSNRCASWTRGDGRRRH